MSGKLVLVTGVSGFIAGAVAIHFIEQGYRVRGTARSAKVKILNDTVKVPGLEFVQVDDIATDDMTEALKDVYAIIHVASPMPGRTGVDGALESAIEGTLNIIRQAAAAKIEKIVLTGTFGSIVEPALGPVYTGVNLTDSQWGEVTREQVHAKADDHFFVYFASKLLAEKAAWEYAKEHPEIDLAVVLPGFVYGPFAKHLPLPPTTSDLNTNGFIYGLMNGQVPPQVPPFFVDVRDVAKAHALALEVPRKPLEEKRYLINGFNFTWRDAAEELSKLRPEYKVAALDTFPDYPGPISTLDTSRAEEALKFGDYIPTGKTLEDTVDSLLVAQKAWV